MHHRSDAHILAQCIVVFTKAYNTSVQSTVFLQCIAVHSVRVLFTILHAIGLQQIRTETLPLIQEAKTSGGEHRVLSGSTDGDDVTLSNAIRVRDPFNKFADNIEMRRFLQAAGEACIADLVAQFRGTVERLQQPPPTNDSSADTAANSHVGVVDAVLFVGRLARALTLHCDVINYLLLLPATTTSVSGSTVAVGCASRCDSVSRSPTVCAYLYVCLGVYLWLTHYVSVSQSVTSLCLRSTVSRPHPNNHPHTYRYLCVILFRAVSQCLGACAC